MKEPMEHSAFPSDETLAAFIDGRLDEEMRKKVVAHVADCEECYGTVMAAGAFQRERGATQTKRLSFASRGKAYLIGTAAAVAAGILLLQLLSVRNVRHRDAATLRDTVALREAANEMPNRVADARLSLDLEYRPLAPRFRGKVEEEPDNLTLLAAAAHVQEDARDTAAGQHAIGVALLLTGYRIQAVATLERAAINETGASNAGEAIVRCTDVSLLNDLSAAHGAMADFSGKKAEGRAALSVATRAWQLEPKSPITVWNRAVAMERVDPGAAVAAWNSYLDVDTTSQWSVAARKRIEKLQSLR